MSDFVSQMTLDPPIRVPPHGKANVFCCFDVSPRQVVVNILDVTGALRETIRYEEIEWGLFRKRT